MIKLLFVWIFVALANGDCATKEDQRLLDLVSRAVPDWDDKRSRMLAPHADISIDEAAGTVNFAALLTHLPHDVHYMVGFEPFNADGVSWAKGVDTMHRPGVCQSDYGVLKSDKTLTPEDFWWKSEATAQDQVDAYYQSGSAWTAEAVTCAQIKLSASFSYGQLLQCTQSDASEHSIAVRQFNDSITELAGRMWISLTRRSGKYEAPTAVQWSFPFVAYVDKHDSKILVQSSTAGVPEPSGAVPAGAVHVRNAEVLEHHHDRLRIVVELLSAPAQGARMKLVDSPLHCTHGGGDAELACASELECQSIHDADVCGQQWDLVTQHEVPSDQHAHEGRFVMRFCDERSNSCSIELPDRVVLLDVVVPVKAKGLAFLKSDIDDDVEFATHISVHPDHHEKALQTGALAGGDRACLQSYVVAPQAILEALDVDLVNAWACIIDENAVVDLEEGVHPRCDKQARHVQLVENGGEPDDLTTPAHVKQHYNISLHDPGSYGVWASTVCFNVDARFMDLRGESVVRQMQLFQAEINVRPIVPRNNPQTSLAVAHQSQSLFNAAEQHQHNDVAAVPESVQRAEHAVRRSGFKHNTLSKWQFPDALRRAAAPKHGSAVFEVGSENVHDLHNVSTRDSSFAIGFIVAAFIFAVCILLFCVWWLNRVPRSDFISPASDSPIN